MEEIFESTTTEIIKNNLNKLKNLRNKSKVEYRTEEKKKDEILDSLKKQLDEIPHDLEFRKYAEISISQYQSYKEISKNQDYVIESGLEEIQFLEKQIKSLEKNLKFSIGNLKNQVLQLREKGALIKNLAQEKVPIEKKIIFFPKKSIKSKNIEEKNENLFQEKKLLKNKLLNSIKILRKMKENEKYFEEKEQNELTDMIEKVEQSNCFELKIKEEISILKESKKLYNRILQDFKGKIRVFLRMKPLNSQAEIEEGQNILSLDFPKNKVLISQSKRVINSISKIL